MTARAALTGRRPVWLALAELYLDTDTRPELPAIALTLARSGLSESELNTVWQHEITPLLHANLSVVAGEWAGWNDDWLVERLQACRPASGWPPLHRALHKLRAGGMEAYFQTALTLHRELLALPVTERAVRASTWSWLAHVYFWPDTPHVPERPPDADLMAIFTALQPHLRPLLNPKEPANHHRLHVLTLIGEPL